MKYSVDLYVGDSVKDRVEQIKANIESWNVDESGDYFVSLPINHSNLFDIVPVRELRLSVYHEYDLKIVGIAGSKDEAVELVRQMIEKIYTQSLSSEDIFRA